MSSDYYDYIEDRGAKLYAAQQARGVQYDQVPGSGGGTEQRTKADISAARAGRHIKYDMAAELKASGHTKRQLLLCDYLFNGSIKLAMEEDWFDLKNKDNIKLLRSYCCLAIEEMAAPKEYTSLAARARFMNIHPKTFIRNHLKYYSKVYQVLDDWALVQFVEVVRKSG